MHQSRLRTHGTTDDPRTHTNDHDIDIAVEDRRPSPDLTPADRRVASRRLTNLGISAAEIARILCVTERTICRYREADRADRGAEPVPASRARRSLAAPPASLESHPGPFAPHAHAQAVA